MHASEEYITEVRQSENIINFCFYSATDTEVSVVPSFLPLNQVLNI